MRTLHCVPSTTRPQVYEDGKPKERARKVYEQRTTQDLGEDMKGSIDLDELEDNRFATTQEDAWPGSDYQAFLDADVGGGRDYGDDDPYVDPDELDDESEKSIKKDHTEL